MNQIQEEIKHSYDEMPYVSRTFFQCSPLRLEACASLLGLTPAASQNARILEIGCSFGGNLIPFAVHNPRARLLGVDLSGEQVSKGQKIIEQIGLKNLTLLQKDICEFSDANALLVSEDGKFDYIIVHGVYSWVPDFVKEAILRVIARYLAPQGVAYLSYNVYPGWYVKNSLRDIMLFAAKDRTSTREKLAAAREALSVYERYLRENLEQHGDAYEREVPVRAQLSWIEMIKNFTDYYVAHEFLSPINDPQYFSDFARTLESNGLTYLCESDLDDIFRPEFNIDYLDAYKNENFKDRIDSEQMMDLLQNRAFRQSLIVRREAYEAVVGKQVGPSDINKLHLVANFKQDAQGTWLNRNKRAMPAEHGWLWELCSSLYPNTINLQMLIALMPEQRLLAYTAFISALTRGDGFIVAKPYEDVPYEPGRSRIKQEVLGYLSYFGDTESPAISFATEFGVCENIGKFDYALALEFDGRKTIEQIAAIFTSFLIKNSVSIADSDGKAIRGEKNIKKYATKYVIDTARMFRNLYLFEWI